MRIRLSFAHSPSAYSSRFACGVCFTAIAGLVGCQGRDLIVNADAERPTAVESWSSCVVGCPLVDGAAPFLVGALRADSGNVPIPIASFMLSGEAGDAAFLHLAADSSFLTSLDDHRFIVSVSGREPRQVSIAELLLRFVVHHFDDEEVLPVTVALLPGARRVTDGDALISLTTDAKVRMLRTPWVQRHTAPIGLAAARTRPTTCALVGQTGTCKGVGYQIVPFSPGAAFGTFQSGSGTGASSPITISFSAPVSSVTITIQDPTFAGSSMTAFDANGQVIGSVGFAFNNTPGVNNPDTKTLSGSIATVLLTPAPADYVAYDGSITVDAEQALIVSCQPSAPTRGETVNCTAALAIPQAFAVVRREAKGDGFKIAETTPVTHNAGETNEWQGTAVVTTNVTVEVEIDDGGKTTKLKGRTQFEVVPRAWPSWQFTNVVGPFIGLAGGMTPAPRPNKPIGLSQPDVPDVTSLAAERPDAGPNSGLAFLRDPVILDTWLVGIHPALEPTPPGLMPGDPGYMPWHGWYDDQNMQGSGTCGPADILALRQEVERHEGLTLTSNSHLGVANQVLATEQSHGRLESLFSDEPDQAFRELVSQEFQEIFNKGSYRKAQRNFDKQDIPAIFGSLGCTLDFNIRDP